MRREVELLKLLLDTEAKNMKAWSPIGHYEDNLKSIDEDIKNLKDKRKEIKREYDSRVEHDKLLEETKAYLESFNIDKEN